MFPKNSNSLNSISSPRSVKHWSLFLVLFLVISPLLVAAAYTSFVLFRDLHEFTLSRREAIAFLAAATLKEKFDGIIDVGRSLSTRVQFQKLIKAGKWEEAIKILDKVPKDFRYIDRVSLYDKEGKLWTATPLTPEVAAVIGKDFSYRDYYQGVSRNWEPYVAEAIKPAVPLGYNLVPVAIPIKSEADNVLGILLLSIKLDTVAAWAKNINVGPAGFAYIVDHKGHLVAHPTLLPAEDMVDFSSVPSVQKVLEGKRGVEVIFNPVESEERITAYEPVPGYGWGVIVVEPTRTAFIERNKAVSRMVSIWVLVILLVGFFTYRLLRDRVVIRAQRDREKLLLESIGDGVVAIDRAFNIVSWNKSAAALTGWKQEEALGKPMREMVKFVHKFDRKESIVFVEEAMLYGEKKFMEPNTLLIRKDGTEIPVGDSATPVFDSSGKVAGAIIVFRDISKEQEAQKIREETLYQTIHDLRAPSNAIKLAAELYSDPEKLTKDKEVLKEGVDIIKQANTRMIDLINSLLEKARSGAGIVKRERVALSTVILSILKESTPTAISKGVKIEYLSPTELLYVLADTERLKEVFSNLIDNAVKYNKDGGRVVVTHQVKDGLVKTTVQDTGIGISAENLPRLFTPYFRANDQKQIQGTGLGLFIVKKFIEEAGGSIKADSKIGEGTIFSVFLPLAGE